MLGQRQMCLSSVRTQAANGLNCSLRQSKPFISVIETKKIDSIVRAYEFIEGQKEQGVTRNRLIKQFHGLEEIFLRPGAKCDAVNQIFPTKVRIVRDKVVGRRLLDGSLLG